jgi:hypothetical protein
MEAVGFGYNFRDEKLWFPSIFKAVSDTMSVNTQDSWFPLSSSVKIDPE